MSNKSSQPVLFGGASHVPFSERLPARPDALWLWLRLLVVLCYGLTAVTDTIRAWATGGLLVREGTLAPSSLDQMLAPYLQSGAAWYFASPAHRVVVAIALVGSMLVVAELVSAVVSLIYQRWRYDHIGTIYLRVRPLRPQSRKTKVADDPSDLWRSLHALLHDVRVAHGPQPWLSLTLHAQPQQPTSLGAVIAAGDPAHPNAAPPAPIVPDRPRMAWRTAADRRALAPVAAVAHDATTPGEDTRQSLKRSLTKLILGQDAETVVDEIADPLAAVLQPGRVICWRELRLSKPPHFLIRTADDFTSDTLGTLAAALRTPAGVVHTEIHVTVRPRRDFDLQTPWRVFARRRYLGVRRKDVLGMTTETKTLEAKMASESYDTSVRILAVADTPDHIPATQAALRELQSAFGQFQTRTPLGVQRFVPVSVVANRIMHVPPPAPRPALSFWAGIAAVLLTALLIVVRLSVRQLVLPVGIEVLPLSVWAMYAGGRSLHAQPTARIQARAPRLHPPPSLLLPFRLWSPPMILSSAEVAGLWHLPRVELKTLISWLPNRFLPAQPHTFIPPGATDRIVFGYATRSDGVAAPVGPTLRALRQVVHLTAGMGAGKTRALANVAEQLIPNGFIEADGKGDDVSGSLAATTLTYIPRVDEERLVIVDVLDAEWPTGLNPLHGIDTTTPGGMTQTLGMILALFARLDPETWSKSQGMQQYAQMGAALVAETVPNPTLASLKQAIQDEGYRATLLPDCTNIEVKNFWEITFPQIGDQQKTSRDALLRRLDNLMVDETTRYLLTQPEPTVDFLECMEQGRIVILPLPHRTLGGIAGFVGMLLLQAIMRAAFRRPGTDQTRTTVPLIIDELQIFIGDGESKDIQDAITQLRGFGIGGIYAHQTLTQLGTLKDEMLTNSASRLILRTQEPDASVYARQFPTTDLTPADISGQDFNEHQYTVFVGGDGPPEVCSIRPLPWPKVPDIDADLPPYRGPDWRTLTPAADTVLCAAEQAAGVPTLEQLIVQLVYGAIDMQYVSAQLALLPDDVWDYLGARWRAVAQHQRRYIIAHPNCVTFDVRIRHDDADTLALLQRQERRKRRQNWLSRLEYRKPRVLAAAVYQRQRWLLNPSDEVAAVQPRKQSKSERGRAAREPYAPAQNAYIPGFTSGVMLQLPPDVGSPMTPDEVMALLAKERVDVAAYAAISPTPQRERTERASSPAKQPPPPRSIPDDDFSSLDG